MSSDYKPLSLGKTGAEPMGLNNSKDSVALNSNDSNFMQNMVKQGRQTRQSNHSSIDDLDNMLLNQTSMGQKSGATNDAATMKLDLYNRLLAAGVIKASSSAIIDNQSQTVALDPETAQRFLNGVTFSKYLLVLKDVVRQVNQDFAVAESVADLNPQNTAQARLSNWNKIVEELDKIAIIVEADQKSLYVAGDSESIGGLFFRIENYLRRISQTEVSELLKSYRPQKKASRPPINVKPGVDIMQMDVSRAPSETESTLEFILNTLCRALSMKPKQAAALLTNNNQYLTHCMVKGVKGRFEPMINWYNDIFTSSQHLAWMLEAEVDQAMETDDPKQIKSSQLNFDKVLQTLSCGCYSPNFQVANTCMKVLAVIGEDFGKNVNIANLAMKWFESQDNGVFTLNYAFKRHFELAEDFVTCIGNFTGGGEQMSWTYMNFLSGFYPDLVDYFGCLSALFPFLEKKFRAELVDGNLLSQMVERCCRFADFDPQNTAQVRMAALCLLTEVWMSFSKEKQLEDFVPLIQTIYKKNTKDRTRSVRLVTAVSMFNLLEKFSTEKNTSAPALFKSLIFSLVENPQDETVRELFLTNFTSLFKYNESIPIRMLIEPLVKSNQLEDLFQFQTFDYDFFTFVAKHPRLKVDNAIQILDMLARQYHNDICSASAIAVPFMIICQRFLGDPSCQEFIFKFMEICMNQLLNLDLANQDLTPQGFNDKGKILALPPPKQSSGLSPKGPRDFKITSSKKNKREQPKELVSRVPVKEDQVNARLKKSLTVNLLLKIQSLIVPIVNQQLQQLCLRAQRQYKAQSGGYLHNGIMAILKFYGDPDRLFNQYLQDQQKMEAEASPPPYSSQPYDRRMLGYESDDKAFSKKSPGMPMLSGTKSQKSLKGAGRNSIALMPITENQQNLRALHELELIRKYKREKEEEEQRRQEDQMKRQSQLDQHLREELRRRRVEKGVPRNVNGVKQELKAVIYNSNGPGPSQFSRQKKAMDKEITLIDLTQEEERDREIIREFMRRHAKIWRYLFTRYANQCYSSKGKSDFDDLKQKISQVNMGEINKMLKEHNTYPLLISKEEIQSLVRQINYKHPAEASVGDIQQLEYSQFLHFIPQLAFVCFQRPPIDKSNFPPVECLRTLIAHFEKATKEKGLPTQLFEDPEASGFQDKELIQAIEAEVAADPNFEMPDGFKKQVIKIPKYDFSIPDCAKAVMKESQIVGTEVMDEILFEVLGIHFLEPKVSFTTQTKVKPVITKKKLDIDPLNYMKKSVKKAPELKKEEPSYSAVDKRKEALEIKPKLTLPLKMLVTKQDQKKRPQFQEVAEVLEEMFQACEKGLTKLPPRLTRAPGQLPNEAKEQREQRELMERMAREEKENKRKQRDERVKKKIKDSNFGGREMPLHEYQRLKEKTEKETKEKLDRQQRQEFQKLAKQRHDEVEKLKTQNLEALKKKKEEKDEELNKVAAETEEKRKEFLKKQKTHLKETFKDTSKRRDDLILRQEEAKNLEKDNEKRLKDQMQTFIKESKGDREVEKQERKAVNDFISKPEVTNVFDTYERPLHQMFKFYASQDSKKDVTAFNVAYLHSVLSFRELVRFGYQQAILPELITAEDMVFVYKHLIREQNENGKTDAQTEQNRGAGMLDYEAFKKAIIRIAIIAQDKLGEGGDLQKKLTADKSANKSADKSADKAADKGDSSAVKKQQTMLQRKQTVAEQKKKQEIDKLREQFHEEQLYKEKEQSRAPKVRPGDKKRKPREPTENEKRRKAEKQYQIDQAKLQQEEIFFQKWLKQRENLGVLAHDRTETEETGRAMNQSMKKKDMTQKELEDLAKQLKEDSKMSKMKVENKQVRKQLDASKIDDKTIEAFIKWLGLEEEDSEAEVNKKLNETLISRKTTMLDKKKTALDASGLKKNESYLETPQKKQEK